MIDVYFCIECHRKNGIKDSIYNQCVENCPHQIREGKKNQYIVPLDIETDIPPFACPHFGEMILKDVDFKRKKIRRLRKKHYPSNVCEICKQCYRDNHVEWTEFFDKLWRKHRHIFCCKEKNIFSAFDNPPKDCTYWFEQMVTKNVEP